MSRTPPRVPTLPESEWTQDVRDMLARTGGVQPGRVLNIFTTLAHHPALLKKWLVFGTHVLFGSTLPARERELAILRIGWLCQSEYEWGQHAVIGERCGLSADEIRRIKVGPAAPEWSEQDRAILNAVDELRADAKISDATWDALSAFFDRKQLMDLVFAVGQYQLVSMALRTFGVELDEGIPGFDG
jgi:4-carboxymuconolactone decarboxylase